MPLRLTIQIGWLLCFGAFALCRPVVSCEVYKEVASKRLSGLPRTRAEREDITRHILRDQYSPQAAEMVEAANSLHDGQPGHDGTPARNGNYTWGQLREKYTFLRSRFREQLKMPEEQASNFARALLTQVTIDVGKTEFPTPIIPGSFQITGEMRSLAKKIQECEEAYNLRNGQFRPNSADEKLFAINGRINALEKTMRGSRDAHRLAGYARDIRVLEQAKKALIDLEQMKQDIYAEFYKRNPQREFPYGFTSKEEFDAFGRQFRNRLREALVHPGDPAIKVEIGGSATDGLSYVEKNEGILKRTFGAKSDIDLVVTLPQRAFDQIFPAAAAGLQDAYIQKGGEQSYPIDAASLRAYINNHPEVTGPIRNLPYLLDSQAVFLGGRKISLLFNTAPKFNHSRPGRFLTLGEVK